MKPNFFPAPKQRGAVLIFALIALLILLVGGVVMVRSMNVTLFSAGNYGFKRDLVNQSERAVQVVYDSFAAGALSNAASRNAALVAANYSASLLDSNAQGIPNALLSDAVFAAVGNTANDIVLAELGVRIRYVVDRMCVTGFVGLPNANSCTMAGTRIDGASGTEQINAAITTVGGSGATALQPVYRISMRVTGPRGTESFFQTTFAI